MDVRRLGFYCLLILSSAGCAGRSSQQSQILPQDTSTDCQESAVSNRYVVQWKDGRVTVEKGWGERKEFLDRFVTPRLDEIKRVQTDYRVQIQQNPRGQSDVDPIETPPDWGQEAIGANALWSAGFKGQNVIVAVIDTGADLNHPQLKNQLYKNPGEIAGDGIDNDGNGYVDDVSGWNYVDKNPQPKDDNGHGSHVAGIVAAEHAAGQAKGVAPQVKVIPLKFLNYQGSGFLSDAVLAIDYAVKSGARVINASWGGAQCLHALEDAVLGLSAKNVVFVAAAGNSGQDLSSFPQFPAAFNGASQITVGASTFRGFTAGFSNSGQLVHLVAPGDEIFSDWYNSKTGSSYAWESGTSMAAPFVSASAALLISAKPQLSATEVKNALLSTVTKTFCCNLTQGEVNVANAAKSLGIIP